MGAIAPAKRPKTVVKRDGNEPVELFKEGGMATGEKWIQKAIKPQNKGALHKQLGVPEGTKIPAKKLSAAAEKGGTLGRRARLAQTLGKLGKK